MKEIWKDIKGFEKTYQISNYGNVKSLDRIIYYKNRWGRKSCVFYKGENIIPSPLRSGHLYVVLTKNNKKTHFQIHQLVAQAFIPNPNNYKVVHHIDHNPKNNRVDNLIWMSDKEHKSLHHNVNGGDGGRSCKTVYQYTLDGELVAIWPCAMEAVRELGYSQGLICACCRGERNKHKGYRWSYVPL